MATSETTGATVVVRLIDPNQGRPLQEWQFDTATEISIGRADERDIVIPDPQVSRLHVTLQFRDGRWWLKSQGRNGVLVDGQMVDDVPTGSELTFRMGANGPLLSFHSQSAVEQSSVATIQSLDLNELAELKLDIAKLESDVRQITDGDFFQKLASQANEFRQHKSNES